MNLGGTVHINKKFCVILLALLFFCYYFWPLNAVSKEKNKTNTINLKELLHVAILSAENGGVEVVDNKDDHVVESKGKTLEGAENSVTTADYKSHCVMKQTIRNRFPTVNLVSEESKTDCKKFTVAESRFLQLSQVLEQLEDSWVPEDDINIWIDPLDATQEYTENLYDYVTTMVCVAVKGKPIIGVIRKPFLKETYWAWVDKSKSSNIKVTEKNSDELVFIVSRSHTGKVKEMIENKLKNFKKIIKDAGGAGYKVLEVINGNADVYLHTTAIKKWDICAGNALLLSVGGQMTTLKNNSIDYSNMDSVNMDGLVATLRNHNLYIKDLIL